MKALRACRQCRESKRKCSRQEACEACDPCQKRGLQCSAAITTHPRRPVDKFQANDTVTPNSPVDLPRSVISELVENYLDKVHGGPHTIFHPETLRGQVRAGVVPPALLCAICAIGCKFSTDTEKRAEEKRLVAEAKRLLHEDLENICIDGVRTCILLSTLGAGNCKPSSEALYVRIAIGMAEILRQKSPHSPKSTLIETETLRRIWGSLYVAERWCFSGLGLRCRMDDTADAYDNLAPMSEDTFRTLSPNGYQQVLWHQSPGLWAHMIKLVSFSSPIQQLNRQIAMGALSASEAEQKVQDLRKELEEWHRELPTCMHITIESLGSLLQKVPAGPFVYLHLMYHHFSTLLFFHFLEHHGQEVTIKSDVHDYIARCKYHASSYSDLLRLANQIRGSEVYYPTVGHMTAISSSVLVHTLLFGEAGEIADAREKLDSNFAVLVQLQRYWPATEAMINRLKRFQDICLLTRESFKLDGWMVRYLLEHSCALEQRELPIVPPNQSITDTAVWPQANQPAEDGRYTDFATMSFS